MRAFALTIFFGAFLLFQIQPMIGKFILPWFGGGPGIWTTCLLFFQVLLLGGYAYAHALTRHLAPRRQVVVHLLLLVASMAVLPIAPSDAWKPQPGADPRWQILLLLGATVGLPYLVLSATGPLVQQWFSLAKPGVSPYRLFALSNAGSLLALLSYPFFFEIYFSRRAQATLWAAGLITFAVCCAWCGSQLWRSAVRSDRSDTSAGPEASDPPIPWLNRFLWLSLPATATAMLLAATNKICQDVAVIPLLWVVPLAIYLITFILCFDNPRWYQRRTFGALLPGALAVVAWALHSGDLTSLYLQLAAYCGALFVCCMVCHGELYRLRPPARQLTSYYLLIATGGALGGLVVALVAPVVFTDFFELHWSAVVCAALFLLAWNRNASPTSPRGRLWNRIGQAAGLVATVVLAVILWRQATRNEGAIVERSRNFYGVLTLSREAPSQSGLSRRRLANGVTTHGLQLDDPALSRLPTSYYGERSGVGRALAATASRPRRIGVIGLGVGTLATYAAPGDVLRFYEINPDVVRLAQDHFTYLSNCAGRVEMVLGDARLSLENEPDQQFDLLILDAFSSDAIPTHLLTLEAFALYQRHTRTNGLIVAHISNRHLDLEPVLANAAARLNWRPTLIRDEAPLDQWWLNSSLWMILAPDVQPLRHPAIAAVSQEAQAQPERVPLWTDDYASLLSILRHRSVARPQPGPAEARSALASILTQRGDYPGAIAQYRSALQAEPNFVGGLNNLAWLLATAPLASVRNGAEAVQLAEKACQLTEFKETMLVGTLAAAYAEAGRFPEAVATAERACALAAASGNAVLLARNQQLRELYRTNQPFHDTPASP